jgi:hypothetical protein
MRKLLLIGSLVALTGVLSAGEKKLMHCFAFTTIKEASAADWKAFQEATDALPKTMSGVVSRVWHGKLRRPLRVGSDVREYGVCMEMPDEAALKTYASHPAHGAWVKVYEKVRVEGTTTFDILGQ